MSTFAQDVESGQGRYGCRSGVPEGPDVEARELTYVPDDTDYAAQLEALHMQQREDERREREANAEWVREALRDLAPAVLVHDDGSRLGTMLIELADRAGFDRDEAYRIVCASRARATHLHNRGLDRLLEAIADFNQHEPTAA